MVAAVLVPLIILAVCLAAVLAVAWRLSAMVVSPKMWDYNTTFDEEISRGAFTLEKYQNEYRGEELYIDSPFGYKIHAMVIPQKSDTSFADGRARVAVIAHGYSYTLYGSIKYAGFFHDLGFACVVYDERNHGKTGKAPTSMGYYEAQDLSAVCAWARERYGPDCLLGTHGESMGAAIVMMHAPTDSRLAFAIEDCGYSDLADELAHQLKAALHLPRWPVLPLANLMVKMRGGVGFGMVKPAEAVARCSPELPILFIHGTADKLVPPWMAETNYQAKRGARSKALFEGAGHADSWYKYPERYAKTVEAFLREYKII
jgi:alpha-beta hydrolase superfamily lysophospholipase